MVPKKTMKKILCGDLCCCSTSMLPRQVENKRENKGDGELNSDPLRRESCAAFPFVFARLFWAVSRTTACQIHGLSRARAKASRRYTLVTGPPLLFPYFAEPKRRRLRRRQQTPQKTRFGTCSLCCKKKKLTKF